MLSRVSGVAAVVGIPAPGRCPDGRGRAALSRRQQVPWPWDRWRDQSEGSGGWRAFQSRWLGVGRAALAALSYQVLSSRPVPHAIHTCVPARLSQATPQYGDGEGGPRRGGIGLKMNTTATATGP
jgi:hypothetical protein